MTINDANEHYLFYYPGNENIQTLARYAGSDWKDTAMVRYSTSEIGTKEAAASFSELYMLLKENVYGVSAVLDDIISDIEDL
jgi:hypothetical protein